MTKRLFVMRPHPKNFHDAFRSVNLIDDTMLHVDPSRIEPGEVADEFFEWGRSPERVFFQEGEDFFGLGFQSAVRDLPCIFPGVFGVNDFPPHQSNSC